MSPKWPQVLVPLALDVSLHVRDHGRMKVVGDLDWERLGRYVKDRRDELDLDQVDVQNAGGPSTATLRLIEGGHRESYSTMTIGALETAMRWARGSVVKILRGAEPDLDPTVTESEPDPEPESQDPDPEDLQQRYGLDPEGADAAAVLIRALRRKRGNSPDQSKKRA